VIRSSTTCSWRCVRFGGVSRADRCSSGIALEHCLRMLHRLLRRRAQAAFDQRAEPEAEPPRLQDERAVGSRHRPVCCSRAQSVDSLTRLLNAEHEVSQTWISCTDISPKQCLGMSFTVKATPPSSQSRHCSTSRSITGESCPSRHPVPSPASRSDPQVGS
jgi:hypothetical protein